MINREGCLPRVPASKSFFVSPEAIRNHFSWCTCLPRIGYIFDRFSPENSRERVVQHLRLFKGSNLRTFKLRS